MTPPDNFDVPDDAKPPDDDGDDKPDENAPDPPGIAGLPEGVQKRKVKVTLSQSAQEVKFADMFGFTIAPAHGLVKFGVFHPETGEFIVHTQIAMTPQGMMALSHSLQKNLEKVKKRKPGPGGSLN